MFFKNKYPTYGEGGLYEGVSQAKSSKIFSNKGCRIHISQDKNQIIKIDIMNRDRLAKSLKVKGDSWIRVNGSGIYWVKAYNNSYRMLKAGLSIRVIK